MTITIEQTDTPSLDNMYGDCCYAEADYTLTIDGVIFRLPRWWALCGWIQPGASADLDGYGLAQWGSSQPGGWSCCDSDGAYTGRYTLSHSPADGWDEPIRIEAPYPDGEDVEITPADLPEWQALIAQAEAATTARETASDQEEDEAGLTPCDHACAAEEAAEDAAQAYRDSLVEALGEALDEAEPIAVPEPDAGDIWHDLDESDVPGIRVGDWRGAGWVIVWRDAAGDFEHRYWPDESDVRIACKMAQSVAVQAILDALPDSE